MSHTTFTNGVTLTDAAWFQDVDTVAYTLFGNGTSYTGVLTLAGTTQSTSTSTGQAIIAGGMGLAKNLWVGGTGNFAGAVTLQSTLALGGTVSGGGNQINNIIIGTSTPLAGTFTTATANAFVPNSSSVPTNGMYLPAANTLGWAINSSEKLRLDANGGMGLGATPNVLATKTQFNIGGVGMGLTYSSLGTLHMTSNSYDVSGTQKYANTAPAGLFYISDNTFAWLTAASGTAGNSISWTTTAQINSSGFFKASNYGTYLGNASSHELGSNVASQPLLYMFGAHATNPAGMQVTYSAAAPNGTGNEFLYCVDTGAQRAAIRSNGGLANYQANDVNLSDLTTKNSFQLYSDPELMLMPRVWDFGKRMRDAWGRFKYNDQTHKDWNNGYGAQLVKIAAGDDFPELVEETDWGTKEKPQMRLSVYDSDLMHIMGAIVTESQFKIDDLIERVSKLEAK